MIRSTIGPSGRGSHGEQGQRRIQELEDRSLAPLAALPSLEELELFGVVPTSRMADELLTSRSLRRVQLSKFRRGEEEKVAAWLAGRG